MKKGIVSFVVVILVIHGCADKKKSLTRGGKNSSRGHGTSGGGTTIYTNNGNTNSYGHGVSHNVDPYGSVNYGNNSGYNYDNNEEYAGSGLKNIYFATDQYNITSEMLPTVNSNAQSLASQLKSSVQVKVEGHCDAFGSDEYNYALGLRRAKSAKEALIHKGIQEDKVRIVSMGESSPECFDSASASCYAKNRRVEFKVIR